jgi:hypothetical protein
MSTDSYRNRYAIFAIMLHSHALVTHSLRNSCVLLRTAAHCCAPRYATPRNRFAIGSQSSRAIALQSICIRIAIAANYFCNHLQSSRVQYNTPAIIAQTLRIRITIGLLRITIDLLPNRNLSAIEARSQHSSITIAAQSHRNRSAIAPHSQFIIHSEFAL